MLVVVVVLVGGAGGGGGVEKTTVITRVSTFIRASLSPAVISPPARHCGLNGALVGSTRHMGGSRGGWVAG